MTVKHIFQIGDEENNNESGPKVQFICESCILGGNKCSSCLEAIVKDAVKCPLFGCGLTFHKKCFGEEICPAHFCHGCKKSLKMEDKVTKCVRCYKTCHFTVSECFNLESMVAITDSKFICKEHLESDVQMLS